MIKGGKQISILAAAAMAAGLGAAFAATGASGNDGPLACEIAARHSGGSIVIAGVARSDAALAGSYSLKVSGPGTNIRQGGRFETHAGNDVTLGTVSLSANGSYDVTLDVEASGHKVSCRTTAGSI